MKWKFFSIMLVLVLALVGCANGDNNDNQEGAMDNNNIEPTRYNNDNTGFEGDRDYNMRRTSDQAQERNDNERNRNGNDRYDVAGEAADQITDKIDEIDNAYVLTTDNNAYVAANLDSDNRNNDNTNDNNNNNNKNTNNNDGDKLTDEVKEQISEIVKSVDNDIDNVYVSTNPDFVDLTNNYVDDVDNGEPIEGFFDQFGNMIERLFPENER
ncbi:hypothetical protein CIL05_10700 [Virgibacillus profundi]|uniref:Lipoprotein YhcN n=1 Tax=Virgibacillus profundi TaxID=2024555 RepID=A0A2A2IFG8_9BACI|nr:YhcN/YlaJ family sporulation lipoprotein [Virgibacillus profundi]PAV29823.1 hypothetical protein CIL05_10700 [Virgibacillus profundi]PXY53994.1 YhcN/YlaJ family sporulation lipoprotein [Virgibacillus profundi]